MQYIVQIYASNIQARGVNHQTNVARSVLLLDTIIFIKIQNTNTLDVKICPQIGLLFVFGQTVKAIAVHLVQE